MIDHADPSAVYDAIHYDPVYGYDDDDDFDWDRPYYDEYDYDDTWGDGYYESEYSRLQFMLAKIRAKWRKIKHDLKMRFSKRYRDSYEEIPF